MKRIFIFAAVLMLHGAATAATCTAPDGTIKEHCMVADADGNVVLSWRHAIERADCTPEQLALGCVSNRALPLSEINSVKMYFHETSLNHYTDITVPAEYTLLKIKKPAGTYDVFATTLDTDSRESAPSERISRVLTDVVEEFIQAPKYPSFLELITSTTLRITVGD